jgi:hypothetical protein
VTRIIRGAHQRVAGGGASPSLRPPLRPTSRRAGRGPAGGPTAGRLAGRPSSSLRDPLIRVTDSGGCIVALPALRDAHVDRLGGGPVRFGSRNRNHAIPIFSRNGRGGACELRYRVGEYPPHLPHPAWWHLPHPAVGVDLPLAPKRADDAAGRNHVPANICRRRRSTPTSSGGPRSEPWHGRTHATPWFARGEGGGGPGELQEQGRPALLEGAVDGAVEVGLGARTDGVERHVLRVAHLRRTRRRGSLCAPHDLLARATREGTWRWGRAGEGGGEWREDWAGRQEGGGGGGRWREGDR